VFQLATSMNCAVCEPSAPSIEPEREELQVCLTSTCSVSMSCLMVLSAVRRRKRISGNFSRELQVCKLGHLFQLGIWWLSEDRQCLKQLLITAHHAFVSENPRRKRPKRALLRWLTSNLCLRDRSHQLQSARITNWFARQSASFTQRRSSNGDAGPSTKTYDAFVQTDDDNSRNLISGSIFLCLDIDVFLICFRIEKSRWRSGKRPKNCWRSRRSTVAGMFCSQFINLFTFSLLIRYRSLATKNAFVEKRSKRILKRSSVGITKNSMMYIFGSTLLNFSYRNELQDRIRRECALQVLQTFVDVYFHRNEVVYNTTCSAARSS
jgi:hypothetical protein